MRISRIADLGGSLPAGKAVDVNLPAVRSCRGAGQRRKLVRQLVGIVRQGIQIAAFEDDGIGIGTGIDADGWRAFVGDNHLHIGGFNRHFDVHAFDLAGAQRNRRRNEGCEAGVAGLDYIASSREPMKRIAAGGIGGCSAHLLAVRCSHGDLRAGNQRAGGVGDMAVEGAGTAGCLCAGAGRPALRKWVQEPGPRVRQTAPVRPVRSAPRLRMPASARTKEEVIEEYSFEYKFPSLADA